MNSRSRITVQQADGLIEIKSREAPARMGKGPSTLTYDASMIPNQTLKDLAIRTAEEKKISYQLSFTARGGTDAGRIHIHEVGCPSIVVGVPTGHIHSHVGLLSLEDCLNVANLTVELLKKLDAKAVEKLTAL